METTACHLLLWSLLMTVPDFRHLEWRRSTPLPEPRSGYAAGVLHGKYVIAGGTYWEGSPGHWIKKLYTGSTHAFDPVTQSWEKLPDAPTAFGYAASAVVDNTLFIFGGYTGSEVSRRILTLTKGPKGYIWRVFGEMPVSRLFAGAVAIGHHIYLLGGTTEFEAYDAAGRCCTSKTATRTLFVMDARQASQGWRELAPYPDTKRWAFGLEADRSSLWMIGGSNQDDPQDPVTNFADVWRYELDRNTWRRMSPLPEPARDASPLTTLRVNRNIVIASLAGKVWQLNLATLKYTELTPLPDATYVDRLVWLNGQIIGAGGEGKVDGPRRRSDQTFIGGFVKK